MKAKSEKSRPVAKVKRKRRLKAIKTDLERTGEIG